MIKSMTILIILVFVINTSILHSQISYPVSFEGFNKNYTLTNGKDNNQYIKISYDELISTDIIGAPSLPVKYVRLLIPSEQDFAEVDYKYSLIDKRTLSNKIYPVQPDIPTAIGITEQDFIKPDPKIYGSNKPWPEEIVEFVHSGYLDNNNHIITLKVIPFQYYPKSNIIEELDKIEINITLKANHHEIILPKQRTFKTQEIWDNALSFIIDNKDDIIKYQHRPILVDEFDNGANQLKKPTPVGFYEYTIITSQALQGYFNNFVNYKRSKGLNVGVVNTNSIYNYYQGDGASNLNDNAGKIRGYLRELYELGGTWVLLAGDFSVVPIRYGCGWDNESWDYTYYENGQLITIEDAYKIPADLYFADRNGNWNVDGDEWTGQPNDDHPDYYPELFVGRLLCTSGQEIINWTNKLIKYEQNPGNGNPEYVIKCFMIESDQMQDGNQAENVKNHLPSFNTNIWHELPNANSANPTFPKAHQVLTEMNNRYGFYGWFGHGAPTDVTTMSAYYNKMPRWCLNAEDAVEFSTNQVLETQDALDNLTNIDHPAIIYSIGCDHTPFDNYHTNPNDYNMGESFTVNNLAGGVAFLGNTRFGFVYSSYKFFQSFADLIEGGNRHLGVAELISKYNKCTISHYLNYSHNLVGCPETQIHTAIPMEKKSIYLNPKELPNEFKIIGNYPNPFNPVTNIKYTIPYNCDVQIKIYDLMGSEVRTIREFVQSSGKHEIMWDGKNNEGIRVSSGIYIYTLKAMSVENNLEYSASSKLILLK